MPMDLTIDLTSLATPISLRPAASLTDEELMRFSEVNKPYRFERNKLGEIVMMSPVGGIGATHEAYVAWALYQWNEATGLGIVLMANAGFNLPDGSCLSPDTAWVSRSRWNALTLAEQKGFPPLCPEFIIEVRSQSDRRAAVEEKMQLWLQNGALQAWLVDPIDANVTIYRPGEPEQTLDRPALIEAGYPVVGFALKTQRLWLQADFA